MNLILLVIFALIFAIQPIAAQNPGPILPAGLTPEEALLMPEFLVNPATLKNLPPSLPPSAVRTMAEWEEVQALAITWTGFPNVLTEIVRYAVDECRVIIITDNSANVSAQLQLANIPLDSVVFLPAAFNSIWIRDYGPWAVYHSDVDSLAIVDYIYNRPTRVQDDALPGQIASLLDLPLYTATQPPYAWVHTGGNLLRDGMGTAWSSDLLLKENPGKNGIWNDSLARRFFGFENYQILRRLPFDGIHHLDMHMLPLDEETLVVGQYPTGIADGPQIEANLAQILGQMRTPFGNPYQIIRQQMPPDEQGLYPNSPSGKYRTYTNAIYINKTLLVPIYDEQYDSTALRIYRENMPGYRVVGIPCNDIIAQSGALHCITKTIGVADPLWIAHPRLRDVYDTDDYYPVMARLQHRSGMQGATLYYRVAPATEYTAVSLMPGIIADGWYYGGIPPQPAGSEVQYYIEGVSVSGKRQVRPLPAPEGYFSFRVKAYTQAPTVALHQSTSQLLPGGTARFLDATQGGVSQRQWLFPGGEPAAAEQAEVLVTYTQPGEYDVQLIVENPLGRDTLLLPAAIKVAQPHEPFSDDFSGGPGPQWTIDNENDDATAWAAAPNINCYGECMRVSNFAPNNRFTREYLRTSVSLEAYPGGELAFDVAYARRNNNDASFSRWDELRVNIIDRNGDATNVYNKGGTVLATRPGFTGQAFSPSSCAEWRRDSIDLSPWAGQAITVEFESIGDNGNNLYLDNVAFRVNARPVVTFLNPLDGTTFSSPNFPFTPTLELAAEDADGAIARIELYENGLLLASSNDAYLSFPYTINEPGIYCFSAIAYDNAGVASPEVTICIEVEESVSSTDTQPLPLEVRVSPNPASDELKMLIQSDENMPGVRLALYSQTGQLVSRQRLDVQAGLSGYRLDLSQLPAGVYLLQLQRGSRGTSIQVVKQ